MEYHLTDDITVSTGLIRPVSEQVSHVFIGSSLRSAAEPLILSTKWCSDQWCVCVCLQGECEWTRHRKQGVYFLRMPWERSGEDGAAVSYSFTFEPGLGDIKMNVSVESLWCRVSWLEPRFYQLPLNPKTYCGCVSTGKGQIYIKCWEICVSKRWYIIVTVQPSHNSSVFNDVIIGTHTNLPIKRNMTFGSGNEYT